MSSSNLRLSLNLRSSSYFWSSSVALIFEIFFILDAVFIFLVIFIFEVVFIWLKLTRKYIPIRQMSPNVCSLGLFTHSFLIKIACFFASGQKLTCD